MMVYYEYIAVNLEQIVYLHFNHMISVLYYALKGFQVLLEHWGSYFTVESYMVGINDHGQVKVWFNRQYWNQSAKPSYILKSANQDIAEKSMVG